MEKLILIVEDSGTCQLMARESLNALGSVQIVDSCFKARELCATKKFDLLVIDLFLPDGKGLDLMAELKAIENCRGARSIIVTSEGEISKKVTAFSIGADDYVVKPYERLELRARAERLFSRTNEDEVYFEPISQIRLNNFSYKASIGSDNSVKEINLTPHEFKILNLLLRNPERIYSRNSLIDLAWGLNTFISERTIDTHISSLRKKLGPLAVCIFCVRGEGYKWQPLERTRTA